MAGQDVVGPCKNEKELLVCLLSQSPVKRYCLIMFQIPNLRKTSSHARQTPLHKGSENEDNRDGDHEGLTTLYHALRVY